MNKILPSLAILFFSLLSFTNVQAVTIEDALQALQDVTENGHFVSSLKPSDTENRTPMGLRHTMGNVTVTLAVSNIKNMKEYCAMDIYARIFIPSRDEAALSDSTALMFGAEGIKISYDGDIVGDARLLLLQDLRIPIINHNASITLRANDTYATLSCQGVTKFGLAADVEFPTTLITIADEDGNATGEPVKTSFAIDIDNWEEWLVSINLPRFSVNGLNGYSFACENVIFDYSANKNGNMMFPKAYRNGFIANLPDINMWEGFYAERILVSIPSHFSGGDSGRHLSFSANNLLIDDNGISGAFIAETELIKFGDTNASGWKMSIEKFGFSLTASTLTEAFFNGHLGIPLGNQDKAKLEYEGLWDLEGRYSVTVAVDSTISFDVLQAKANIFKGSYVTLAVKDNKFKPEANLSGTLDLAVKKSAEKADTITSFNGIVVQNLHIKTETPYVTADYMGYENTTSVMNLPVSISELGLSSNGNTLDFHAGLRIDLGEGSGESRFSILGDLENSSGVHQWKFRQFRINDIMLNMTVAESFSLNGRISARYDDPVYGDGFAGDVELALKKGLKFELKASTAFGSKDGSQYWYVDAGVEFQPEIPCSPYVQIGGFAGGASNGMRKRAAGVTQANAYSYIPDSRYGLGFKAGVTLTIPYRQTASLRLMLEMQFSKYGGLMSFGLYGHGEFLSTNELGGLSNLKELISKADVIAENMTDRHKAETLNGKASSTSGIVADMAIEYDHLNKSFHTNFEVYINYLDGFLRGSGNGGMAGWVVLHIDEKEWYLQMGTPSNPIGIELNALDLVRVQTRSYLMAGHHLPDALPVPSEIRSIIPVNESSLRVDRKGRQLEEGRGFAFGASLSVDTGDLFFLILYARFQAGMGFDLMLREYPNAQCAGRSGTLGMDGWYAMGQVYAYLAGELGVGVNLWFIKAKFPIIKGGTAAILQGKLPNPTWFSGCMGVKFELLGGLIKGNMNFKFELGEQCDLLTPGQSPIDMEMIGDISPSESGTDVFAVPQVAFNMAIEKAFDTRIDESPAKMKIVIDECTVTEAETGSVVDGTWKWNNDHDKYSFYSSEILKPQSTFVIKAAVGFMRLNNGVWETIYTAGEKSRETREVTFTTGDAPNYIPERNIAFMYPVKSQQNFHVAEYGYGFIQLDRGQSYLFADSLRFTTDFIAVDNGNIYSSDIKYLTSEKRVEFPIPANLPTATDMTLSINGTLKDATGKSSESAAVYTKVESGGGNVSKKTNQADKMLRDDVGLTILSYSMRTSKYKTFKEKISATKVTNYFWNIDGTSTRRMLGIATSGQEPFDNVDLQPTEFCKTPLITIKSTGGDKYYTESIGPNIYIGLEHSGITLSRDTSIVGVPPFRAVILSPSYQDRLGSGNINALTSSFPYIYRLQFFYSQDYYDILNKAVNKYTEGSLSDISFMNRIMEFSVPPLYKGDYKTRMTYTLPNGLVTSTAELKFKHK
ncbi:MAG: hypothetical protein SPK61_05700 [Bacteroidales bacterium]|nr:hypothetical protein [Bacteroidales bacterium]MDY6427491.1 hypothetical protein [Bacteroidales bacterium]